MHNVKKTENKRKKIRKKGVKDLRRREKGRKTDKVEGKEGRKHETGGD